MVNLMVRGQGNRAGLGWKPDEVTEELITAQQAQIKQGWSLLATLHCVLLPDKVVVKGSKVFKRPQIEMMARRWQHHCLEVCTYSTISNLSLKAFESNKYFLQSISVWLFCGFVGEQLRYNCSRQFVTVTHLCIAQSAQSCVMS